MSYVCLEVHDTVETVLREAVTEYNTQPAAKLMIDFVWKKVREKSQHFTSSQKVRPRNVPSPTGVLDPGPTLPSTTKEKKIIKMLHCLYWNTF